LLISLLVQPSAFSEQAFKPAVRCFAFHKLPSLSFNEPRCKNAGKNYSFFYTGASAR
jgi:hypothetical protein